MGQFCAEATKILLKLRAPRANFLNFGIWYWLDFTKKGSLGTIQ